MHHTLLRPGDRVIYREAGRPLSGATVTGFNWTYVGRLNPWGAEPGVYSNKLLISLRLDAGGEVLASAGLVDARQLSDPAEYERRRSERDAATTRINGQLLERVKPLPDTPFYEGDEIWWGGADRWLYRKFHRLDRERPGVRLFVKAIDYDCLERRLDKPAYFITDSLTAEIRVNMLLKEEQMKLVQRGPLWLKDRMRQAIVAGAFEEPQNPVRGSFEWTVDEVKEGIRAEIVDGFLYHGPFSDQPTKPGGCPIRFHDRELGRLVAAATLAGLEHH